MTGVQTCALPIFVVGFPYRLVDFCQFAQLFQVIVHLLVADDGQSHVILEMDVLVFVQYGFAVFVQFNRQAVGSLDCGYFDVVGLHIASFQIANIRIPQTRKAAEQENITHTFQVLLILGYLVVFQLVQFIPSQEDYFFRGGFQFRFERIVCNVLMMSFLEAPAQEPFVNTSNVSLS